jgi:antitoxin ParD1/3/4
MPTRNINLTDHLDHFIEREVDTGRYGNASEVVRDGLRLLEQRNAEDRAKLKLLRKAVQQGLDEIARGSGVGYHSRRQLEDDVDRLGEEASARLVSDGMSE